MLILQHAFDLVDTPTRIILTAVSSVLYDSCLSYMYSYTMNFDQFCNSLPRDLFRSSKSTIAKHSSKLWN